MKNSQLLAILAIALTVSCSKPDQSTSTADTVSSPISDTTSMPGDYLTSGESDYVPPSYDGEEMSEDPDLTNEDQDYLRFQLFLHLRERLLTTYPQPIQESFDFSPGAFTYTTKVADGGDVTVDGSYSFTKNYDIGNYGLALNYILYAMGASPKSEQSNIDIDFMNSSGPTRSDELGTKAIVLELTPNDIEGLSKEELSFVRNEIYARHGHVFKTPKMIDYFSKKPWYKAHSDATNRLNAIEKKNIDFLKKAEDNL